MLNFYDSLVFLHNCCKPGEVDYELFFDYVVNLYWFTRSFLKLENVKKFNIF